MGDTMNLTVAERMERADGGPVPVTRREVAAAKLRIAADRRFDRATPEWIRKVAAAEPEPRGEPHDDLPPEQRDAVKPSQRGRASYSGIRAANAGRHAG